MLMVSWFHRFRDVSGFRGFIGFVASRVSFFHTFRSVSGFMVL